MNFSDRLRQKRREKDLTQTELAEKMGVHKVTIQNWEKGKNIGLSEIYKLSEILEVTAGWLVDGEYKNDDKEEIEELQSHVLELERGMNRIEKILKDNDII